ncbi:hypothetical protein [Novosphingobium panipatense]|uniref:hypothetical protein n=1 Tax=Novosphingobium panipatense TaxID=428991 RepID=UPI00360B9935
MAVVGYEETVQLLLDTEHFSEINAVTGGMVELPFIPEGTTSDRNWKPTASRSRLPTRSWRSRALAMPTCARSFRGCSRPAG